MWHLILFICFVSSVSRDKSGMVALTFHKNDGKSMALFMPDHFYSRGTKLCENSCSISSCICFWVCFCHQPLFSQRTVFLPNCHLKVSEKPRNLIFLLGNNLFGQAYIMIPWSLTCIWGTYQIYDPVDPRNSSCSSRHLPTPHKDICVFQYFSNFIKRQKLTDKVAQMF